MLINVNIKNQANDTTANRQPDFFIQTQKLINRLQHRQPIENLPVF